jgi:L,D-transpeptidase YbiS
VPAFLGILFFLLSSGFDYEPLAAHAERAAVAPPDTLARGARGTTASRDVQLRRLEARLDRLVPRQPFVVVDRVHNRLYLRDGERLLLDAVCSSGSGMVLTAGDKRWVFDTPRGHFRILSKHHDPVWKKPDWAFIEEGKPIPDDPTERIEAGVLGEYALYLGDGYLIHGTLYERLLGYSVTHGCVRVGRDDLRKLYESVDIGTEVYIY